MSFLKLLLGLAAGSVLAATDPAQSVALLQQKCAQCHGETSGMSGLRVTSRESLLRGGTRGAAIVPGKAGESLLFKAVAHIGELSMPPGGALKPEEVAVVKEWIDGGAIWTSGVSASPAGTWSAIRKPRRPYGPA